MKRAPIYRTNTGSICAIGSVEKDVDPVPNNRARILGVTAAVLQSGLDVEVAGGGGFGALLAPGERAAGFCQGKAQRVTSKGRGTTCGQEGRIWQSRL